MNTLKSFFVSNYMVAAMGIMIYAIWKLVGGGNPYAWVGVLLTTTPLMMNISMLLVFKNKARFPLFGFATFIGVVLVVWAWSQQAAPILPLALAVGGGVGFSLYAYWHSSFSHTDNRKLKIGVTLPHFDVLGLHGKLVSKKQLTDRPTILIFHRGNWSPLCMAQIKEITKQYQDNGAVGVRVAFIAHNRTKTQLLSPRNSA